MDRERLASELIKIAKELTAVGAQHFSGMPMAYVEGLLVNLSGKRINGWVGKQSGPSGDVLFWHREYLMGFNVYVSENKEGHYGITVIDANEEYYTDVDEFSYHYTGDARRDANSIARDLKLQFRRNIEMVHVD